MNIQARLKQAEERAMLLQKESRYYSLNHGKACSRKGKTLYNIGRRWYLQ